MVGPLISYTPVMLDIVIEARKASIGPGMDVRRILPFRLRRMVGPFIFMDHAGPVQIQPQSPPSSMDVLPHPHIGISTVSYLFNGKVTHRDSLGVEQVIMPGEVNWMTAGKGIAHSERFEDPAVLNGGELEMIQTWVALPEKDEEASPTFKNYTVDQLPVFTDTGVWMRLIAGEAYGLTSNVKTSSPLFYLHVALQAGARFGLPKENTTLMMLGGERLGERYIWWNFVSSRKERIEQAKEDWKQGRIVLPPNDNKEFVPLPKENFK